MEVANQSPPPPAVESVKSRVATILNVIQHEIQGPVNNIRQYIELIRRELDKPDKDVNLVDIRELLHGLLTVEDIYKSSIVRFSEASHNIFQQKSDELLSVRMIMEMVSRAYKLTLLEKKISLSNSIATSVPPVLYGDATYLQQIIYNLVGNAIKYTPSGGRIDMFCSRQTEDQYIITVSDTGIGIPPDALSKIFDKGFRVDGSPGNGEGLGLYVAQELTTLMGGSVEVENRPVGTLFKIQLPFSTFLATK